jgi:hypothetical protein
MPLFIPSILANDWAHFNALLTVLAVLYSCVFLSVLIDLYFGVKRAKQQGIARTSYGYRRTISKLISYFGLMFMFTIADIAASVLLNIPYFTVIGAIGIIAVEAKSVFENLKHHEKNIKELPKTLHKLLENKDNLKNLIKFLNNQTNK